MNWNDLFEYRDGVLFWKIRRKGLIHTRPVGAQNKGYVWVRSRLLEKQVAAHRVIYEMHHGETPSDMVIDHIDGNTLNNRIENLRLATRSQNAMNAKGKVGKRSGLPKNVFVDWEYGEEKTYRAQVCTNGNVRRVGNLPTIEAAVIEAKRLRDCLHGDFARSDVSHV